MSIEGKETIEQEGSTQEFQHDPQYEVKIIGADTSTTLSDQETETDQNKEVSKSTETDTEKKEQETIEATEKAVDTGYDDAKVLAYFKSKGKEFESVDDLFKEPEAREVIKEVDKYEGINFDEEDLQYHKFKKETGRSRKEFEALNQDLDAISPIEVAKRRIERETGEKFSKKDTVEYLEDEFGIDLSDLDNLSVKDKIKLKSFTKPELDAMVEQKEKYKKPIEVKPKVGNADDFITLDNGTIVTKERYEEQVNIRNSFLEQVNSLPNSVDKLSFKFNVDDNGISKEVDFDYDISQNDTQEMVSKLSDIDGTIKKHFSNEDGSVDVKALGIALQFGTQDKLGKLLDDAYQKGRADNVEASSRTENNVNFNSNGLQKPQKRGEYDTKTVAIEEIFNR